MKDYSVKQNKFLYRIFRGLSIAFSKLVFKRSYVRNELREEKGPCVVIANHQAALDFVNIIGATKRPMHFVISQSFYLTMPLKWIVKRLGFIPKQQFQTEMSDLRKMKGIIDGGGVLVIFPAGLMSDDGTPSPMPIGTYKFLSWLGVDVYMAENIGTYFAQPKWRRGGFRSGKTFIDIYKLFDNGELSELEPEEVKRRVDDALGFDAYREQDERRVKYHGGDDIRGLEDVLYMCPCCGGEFTTAIKGKNEIYCRECGYSERADAYQLLHKTSECGEEISYISDWNAKIYSELRRRIESGELTELSAHAKIETITKGEDKLSYAGECEITLRREGFTLEGRLDGEDVAFCIPNESFASLPYKPGSYIEIQEGDKIYRCSFDDGRIAIKFINMTKIFYEIHTVEHEAHRIHAECHA